MLCELGSWFGSSFGYYGFVWLWLTIMVSAFVFLMAVSAILFYHSYWNPTYEMWRQKTNPKYPSPAKVREEIILMCKGLMSATLCPTMAIWLGYAENVPDYARISQAYCSATTESFGYGYLLASFLGAWLVSDFVEFYYHRLGHIYGTFWEIHKSHHKFYNPTPFAVIADEYLDQLARSSPLLWIPILVPINMDMLFFLYAVQLYFYGLYLHWGYELEYPDAHHPIWNTSFQHYLHHAISIKNKPYHTGFMIKLWDQWFGSMYDGECFCAKCSQKAGLRSVEEWKKVTKPDYSVLLSLQFWMDPLLKKSVAVADDDAVRIAQPPQ